MNMANQYGSDGKGSAAEKNFALVRPCNAANSTLKKLTDRRSDLE